MIEQYDTSNSVVAPGGGKIGRLGLASLVLAAAAIPLFYISIHRIKTLHNSFPAVCLVRETALYRTVNFLCPVLPCLAVTSGVLSLIRCRRNKTRFASGIPAIAGIVLAVAGLAVYFLNLIALARDNFH